MQLFLDSPAMYTSPYLAAWWKGGFTNALVATTPLPPNSQSGAQVIGLSVNSSTAFVQSDNYGNNARLIGATRFYRGYNSGGGTYAGIILSFVNSIGVGALTTIASIIADNSGTYLYKGSAALGTLLATGPVIPLYEWHHYEFDVTFGTTSNASLYLYVDGNPTPFLQATGVSLTAAHGQILQLGNGAPGGDGSAAAGGFYADTYLFNGVTGTGGTTFTKALAPQGLGAAKTGYSVANGVGAVSAWTPNGAATIWQSINAIPSSGDTAYASDSNPGDAFQCTFGTIPAIQTLISAQLSVYAREDDAGPRSYQSGFYKGGTYGYSGVNQFLGGTYNYIFDEYETNPVTGSPWIASDLTGLQFGAKLTN